MNNLRKTYIFAALVCGLGLLLQGNARSQSTCDNDMACIGDALDFPGGNFDYVDVFTTPPLETIDQTDALTIEMWINIRRQPGVRQYIGGIWGPRTDRDDRWVLYVDETDSLTFELSNDSSNFAGFDNTIVKVAAPYDTWFHLAGMWDGATQEARLYIDGSLVGTDRNAQYPIEELRSTISYLQFGSFNGITNDPALLKNFTGLMDEIRYWNRTIPEDELRCNRFASLSGSEAGLVLYLRCNEGGGAVLCDASDFDGRANKRGSIDHVPATRIVPQSVFISPTDFRFPLGCISDTTLVVTIVDTSACGNTVDLSLSGQDRQAFSLGANTVTLAQNDTQRILINTNLRVTGNITANVRVRPRNTCSPAVDIPISITRSTDLSYSAGHIRFDTLFGCIDKPDDDTVITVCNTTNGPIDVSSFTVSNPAFSVTPLTPVPLTLLPGECIDVRVLFAPADTGNYSDTLRIASTDKCPGSGLIPLFGRKMEIVSLTLDSIDFDTQPVSCRMSVNLAEEFFIRSLVNENFTVEAFETTDSVFTSPTSVPLNVRPNRAYRAYIRFKSNVEGFYSGIVRIRINFRGCTVYKEVHVKGNVIHVSIASSDSLVDFGTVIVGQTSQRSITIENIGIDSRQLFLYMGTSGVFTFSGNSQRTLDPGESSTIDMTFRPLNAQFYRDTLTIQDVACQVKVLVILEGNGIFGTLRFDPGYILSRNVINCECRFDTINVTNISGGPLTLNQVQIFNTTKFTFQPPLPVNGEVLQDGETRMYILEFCPDGSPDFLTERGELVFNTDGPDGELRVQLLGTNIEPKLYISPLTNYGDVEVGATFPRQILITNVSPVPVLVDGIQGLPPEYSIVGAQPPLGSTLAFRDTMIVTVAFSPPNDQVYTGTITVESSSPCPISATGNLTGRGIIVPLFVPWTTIVFQEATRCDSVTRMVGLVNDGSVPIRVDSIWIEGPDAEAFRWEARTFAGILPYDVPEKVADSIAIIFAPIRSSSVTSFAQIKIAATTRLGPEIFTINLSGTRIEQFIPNTNNVAFAATPVNQVSPVYTLVIQNPSYIDTLIIDSLLFEPDQQVFGWSGTLPAIVPPRETVTFDLSFIPRAALDYAARIRLVNRQPCAESDTTIGIQGSGYTPPYLVTLCAQTPVEARIGDIITVPVMLNRDIPQNPVDIDMFIEYYRRALIFLGAEPEFTSEPVLDTLRADGVKLSVRGNQNVASGLFMTLRFKVLVSDQDNFLIRTDSISFASDSTFFLALFGDGCFNPININPHCNINRLTFSTFDYILDQNYPNPFSATTTIEFETVEDTHVRIEVRDMSGGIAAVLTDNYYVSGRYALSFDAGPLPSGTYVYTLRTPNFTASRTMMIAR
ncbi:MAG: hypothetical protein CL946_01175 [Ectothiorhodospiraceae bacterium]|nr:hypothetical protein [Ectothiorhodospiraceae bacterium]